MAHYIDGKDCLKCGVCVPKCPQKAISEVVIRKKDRDIHNTRIDPLKCNDCGICEQAGDEGYFCPAEAIKKA